MQVRINNKDYPIGQLGFKDMAAMESIAQDSIITVFQRKQIFVLAEAFVGNVVGCDKEEAARLCEQHILGGGKLDDIYKAFTDAVNESGFFKKLLGIGEKKTIQRKTASKTEQKQP